MSIILKNVLRFHFVVISVLSVACAATVIERIEFAPFPQSRNSTAVFKIPTNPINSEAAAKLGLKIYLYVKKTPGIKEIFTGFVAWTPAQDYWITEYRLIIKAISPDHCFENFTTVNMTLSKFASTADIPTLNNNPQHRFHFRCNYSFELSTVPCNKTFCYKEKQNYSISDCLGKTCECKKIPAVQDLTVTMVESDLNSANQELLVQWNYSLPADTPEVANFTILLKRKIDENFTYPRALQTVPFINAAIYERATNKAFAITIAIDRYLQSVTVKPHKQILTSLFNINFTYFPHHHVSPHQRLPENYLVTKYQICLNRNVTKGVPSNIQVVANGVDGCPGHSSETEIKILGNQRRNDCQFEKTNRTSSDQLKTSEVKSQDQMGSVLVALLASGAITVIFVGVASLWCRKRLNRNVQRLRFLINPVRRSSGKTRSSWEENELYVIDHYEISHKQLIVGKEIGKGAFGKVCIASLLPRKNTVAVKYLREHPSEQEKEDFLREITLMKTTGRHPNVIHMLACCTLQQPLCMVMEFIEYGDLLKYLRTLRSEYEKVTIAGIIFNSRQPNHSMQSITKINSPNGIDSLPLSISDSTKNTEGSDSSTVAQTNPSDCSEMTAETRVYEGDNESFSRRHVLDSKQLINFAMQIASGMNHLGVKEIVHRDLAARNVLIGLDKVLKISDFGLSRTGVYVTRRGGRVPLRWLSIEAIRDNLYSTQSDVWAFGVVLWEICTLGGFPYSSVADKDVYKFLLSGRRLERPAQCSDKLYDVMMQCWDADPNARPTFQQLLHILGGMEREPHEYVNFDSKNGFISMCPTEEIV